MIYRSGSGVPASAEAIRDASFDFETCDLNQGRGRSRGNSRQGETLDLSYRLHVDYAEGWAVFGTGLDMRDQ